MDALLLYIQDTLLKQVRYLRSNSRFCANSAIFYETACLLLGVVLSCYGQNGVSMSCRVVCLKFCRFAGDGDKCYMRGTMDERANALEIDLQELLLVYLRKWWIIILCLAIGASVALGFTWKFVTPQYRASISIYVNNSRGAEDMDYLSSSDLTAAQRLVNTYVSIAKSDRVLDRIAENLGGDYTSSELARMITAKQMNETEIFQIYVINEDPVEAARIANAAAEVAPAEISNLIEGTSARLIDLAKIPTSRYSPSYSRSVLIGGAIGLVLALLVLTIFHLKDTRIKDENDLTSLFELPVLGRIPNFEFISAGSSYGYSSTETEKEAVEK